MRICLLLLLVACATAPQASSSPSAAHHPPPTIAATPPPAKPQMPACGDYSDMKCLVSQLEYFSNQMCACSDKTCADGVNAALTKWGTELANNQNLKSQKPDPDISKRSADIMTRYTECMVKVMTAGGHDVPAPIEDPCGGDPNPCGD